VLNLLNCKKCNTKNKLETKFWLSKVDAIGFLFLSALLTLPIYFVSFLIESSQAFAVLIILFSIFLEYIEKEYKVVAFLVAELIIETAIFQSEIGASSIVVITAFIVTFYNIGKKVYGFFFMCVNYKLEYKVHCLNCNTVVRDVKLPTIPKE
jgi:hypothetical protein